MSYVNISKSYHRNLVKKLFEQEKTDSEIAYLSESSESWIHQLQTKHEQDVFPIEKRFKLFLSFISQEYYRKIMKKP